MDGNVGSKYTPRSQINGHQDREKQKDDKLMVKALNYVLRALKWIFAFFNKMEYDCSHPNVFGSI